MTSILKGLLEGFSILLRLIIESVFVIDYSLYYFSEGVLLILGKTADIFLGLGRGGTLTTFLGFSMILISCLTFPTDLVFPIIYFFDSILNT